MAAAPYFMNLNEVTCDRWEFLVFRCGENSILWLPNWSNLIRIHLFQTRPHSFLNQTFIRTWCPSKMSRMCTSCLSACAIYVNTQQNIMYLHQRLRQNSNHSGGDCGCYGWHNSQTPPQAADWFTTAQHVPIGKKANKQTKNYKNGYKTSHAHVKQPQTGNTFDGAQSDTHLA